MVGLCNVLASSFYSYYHAKKRLHKQKICVDSHSKINVSFLSEVDTNYHL